MYTLVPVVITGITRLAGTVHVRIWYSNRTVVLVPVNYIIVQQDLQQYPSVTYLIPAQYVVGYVINIKYDLLAL